MMQNISNNAKPIDFLTLLHYSDDLQADGGLRGSTDSTVSRQTKVQHHFCRGQLREHESCSGISETPADPDAADEGLIKGLSL